MFNYSSVINSLKECFFNVCDTIKQTTVRKRVSTNIDLICNGKSLYNFSNNKENTTPLLKLIAIILATLTSVMFLLLLIKKCIKHDAIKEYKNKSSKDAL